MMGQTVDLSLTDNLYRHSSHRSLLDERVLKRVSKIQTYRHVREFMSIFLNYLQVQTLQWAESVGKARMNSNQAMLDEAIHIKVGLKRTIPCRAYIGCVYVG